MFTLRQRHTLYQLALVALLGALLLWLFSNLLHNLASRGITIGFSYLAQEAGFDISESLIAYDPAASYAQAFLVGVLNTLCVAAVASVGAGLLGLTLGVARMSPNWLVRQLAMLYIESIRNVPLLLQLLLWYGMLTELFPAMDQAWRIGEIFISQRGIAMPWPAAHSTLWSVLTGAQGAWSMPLVGSFNIEGGKLISPEFMALTLGLTLYTAAFIAEIVRGGILAVAKGQSDAAAALGFSRAQVLRYVVLPQALRVMVPPLTSQFLNLTKNSSLAVAIGYPDLVSVSNTTLNQTGQAIEAMGLMLLVYLGISLLISSFMNWFNRRVQLVGR